MHYFEPWIADPWPTPKLGLEPAESAIPNEEYRPTRLPWLVHTREGVKEPCEILCWISPGEVVTDTGRVCVAMVDRHCEVEGGPTHEQVARRIAEAVTSIAGIEEPVSWVTDVRRLLLRLRESGDEEASRLINQSRR